MGKAARGDERMATKDKEKDSAKIAQLQSLAAEEQIAYAERLLATSKDLEVLQAALAVLAAHAEPRSRRVILDTYAQYEGGGPRRDTGCHVRVALVGALRPVVQWQDCDMLERSVSTYEFLPPGRSEVAAGLRATALVTLNEIDRTLAGWHAVHLLTDTYTSSMSGEPAVTAARVLAAQGESLPLYAYTLRNEAGVVSEVLGECLRSLTTLPRSLLAPLVERYLASRDEIVLLGVFDLLIAREADTSFDDIIVDFLAGTKLYNIYRYLVSTIVASRRDDLRKWLEARAQSEGDRTKAEILEQALAVRRR
jgi:hypothetical protein